jgi:hypothetical protein
MALFASAAAGSGRYLVLQKRSKRHDAVACGRYARESEIAGESEVARDDEIDPPGLLHK